MNSSIRIAVVGMASMLLLAACNGSDDTATTTLPAPSTEATSQTNVTSTTVAPTTTSTSTTDAPSTSTSTTPATTNETVDSTTTTTQATTESEIAAALIEAREAYLYAVYNLDAPDAMGRLDQTHAAGSPSLEVALENVQALIDNGWLARPNPAIPDTVTIETDVLMVNETTAELVACVVGAGEVYDPRGNADGSDLIVNGDIEAALNRVTMVIEDGRWKLLEGSNLSTQEGTKCVVE